MNEASKNNAARLPSLTCGVNPNIRLTIRSSSPSKLTVSLRNIEKPPPAWNNRLK